jgi:tellurite resistance protein TehA-like permease
LTLVAGTAVLGSRLLRVGWVIPAGVALAAATVLWAALVPRVLRAWARPTVGSSFVLAVSTESLAVLAANAAIVRHETWLALAALTLLLLGLAGYAFVLGSFDRRQLRTGCGDHWVAGGALAIATVACDRTAAAAAGLPSLHVLHGALADGAIVLWIAAAVWLPLLLAAELRSPRIAYDARRWSTVFPFGMYAVCSFRTGEATVFGGPGTFARVWIWAAVAVWLVVAIGMLRRGAALARSGPLGAR